MVPGDFVDLSNFLAHKWYREELGRVGSAKEVEELGKAIRSIGAFQAFANVYGSKEAKDHRARVGRKV